MLLRSPISTTKRFFQRTLQSFKSYLSGTGDASYHKLPKTPIHMEPRASSEEKKMLPQLAAEEAYREKPVSVKKSSSSPPAMKVVLKEGGEEERRDVKICMVAKRLKEMEMVDRGNVDHLLDIDEVFHYYTRLTCPAYLDIVDEFFMELYAEFLGNSRLL